ncbi:MAG: hypothetical protein H7039_24810 [Bryobacteraceae bacterium]|nr:hypothetical protein [Bryobacteraceae bacterium]
MNYRIDTRIASSILMLALAASAGAVDAPLVKMYTGPGDKATIDGYSQIFVAGPDFRTAAMVDVIADPSKPGLSIQTQKDAQRASNNNTAAVMAVVGKVLPVNIQLAQLSEPSAAERISFKESWNSAQAWATMRGDGMPYLSMQAFGKASASGTAAWNARIVMPQSNPLFVRFVIPQVSVKGVVESDGPAIYQGRYRTELLVNGHSVWTSEANRQNELYNVWPNACTDGSEKSTSLTQFGSSTGLVSNPATAAAEKNIYVGLGSFSAGQEIEVSLIIRADTQVKTKCCIQTMDGAQESFCTGSTTTVSWSNTQNPVAFRMGPAL